MNTVPHSQLIMLAHKKNTYEEAKSKSLPILNAEKKVIGYLVPVGKWILSDRGKIEEICRWRQKAMEMFLTQFQSSIEKTYSYLENIAISRSDRILFLIYEKEENFVGHIGIANVEKECGEIDNVMRGIKSKEPRLIYFAEIALLNWSFTQLQIEIAIDNIFSHNTKALTLQEALGFVVSEKQFLRKVKRNDLSIHEVVDSENANVDYDLVTVMINKSHFMKQYGWIYK